MVLCNLYFRACQSSATKQKVCTKSMCTTSALYFFAFSQFPDSQLIHNVMCCSSYSQAMFVAATEGYPQPFKNPSKWSQDFKHFLGRCLELEPSCRATADELLKVWLFSLFLCFSLCFSVSLFLCFSVAPSNQVTDSLLCSYVSSHKTAQIFGVCTHEKEHEEDTLSHIFAEHHGKHEPRRPLKRRKEEKREKRREKRREEKREKRKEKKKQRNKKKNKEQRSKQSSREEEASLCFARSNTYGILSLLLVM